MKCIVNKLFIGALFPFGRPWFAVVQKHNGKIR